MPNYKNIDSANKTDKMSEIFDETTRVIIIAVENYRFEKISKVKYAISDATAFRDFLISDFKIKPENIKTYFDKYASKTALEDELKYEIRNLQNNDKFIFYYAGHGFYGNGTNKLTAWDTSDTNFLETTLILKDILLDPLNESCCKKSLIFLDTCSKHFSEDILSREAISNINERELDFLIKQSEYCAIYMSCSPGEKSYSDDNLQHGIWTYHLLNALKGNVREILVDEKYLTDVTLRDYLRRSVPQFISEKTDIRASQTPYSKLMSSNSFVIHEIKKKIDLPRNNEFPALNINFSDITLINRDVISVKEASGFKNNHWPPDKVSSAGVSFILSAFKQDTSDEIQNVYQNAKDILKLRRNDNRKEIESEGGFVENQVFKYELTVSQCSKYPSYGQFDRELTVYNYDLITAEFDDIFEIKLKTILLDSELQEDSFEEIVESFENFAESNNGKLIDDDRKLWITYNSIDGLQLILKFREKKILVTTKREYRIKDFLDRVEVLINQISKNGFTFGKK